MLSSLRAPSWAVTSPSSRSVTSIAESTRFAHAFVRASHIAGDQSCRLSRSAFTAGTASGSTQAASASRAKSSLRKCSTTVETASWATTCALALAMLGARSSEAIPLLEEPVHDP